MRFWTRCFYKGLIYIYGMVQIILQSQKPLDWGSNKLRVPKTISNIFKFFLRFNWYIVFVSFCVEMAGDWPISSLLFPLFYVFKIEIRVEWGICYKSILIGKCEFNLILRIAPREAQIWQIWLGRSIWADVCVDSRCTFFVWPIQIVDSIPNLSLDLKIMFEVINYLIISLHLNLIMVFIQLTMNIFWGFWVLMRCIWVFFVCYF